MTQPNEVASDTAVEVAAATLNGLKGELKKGGKASQVENGSEVIMDAPEVPAPTAPNGSADDKVAEVANGDSNGSTGEEAPSVEVASGSEPAAMPETGDEPEAATTGKPQRQRNRQKGKAKEQKGPSEDTTAEAGEGAESTGAEKDGEEKKEKEVRYFYMVRLPRPEGGAQDAETASLEPLVSLHQERIEYLNAALRVKQVSKSNAQGNTQVALDNLRVVSAEIRSKLDTLRPMQDREKAQREEENSLKAQEKELTVKSEEELDRRIASMEYKIAHESLILAEEKRMVREIKQLGNMRETVREFQARKQAVAEARQDRDGEEKMLLKVMREEVDLLKMQENILREIFRKRQEEEKELEASIKAIVAERAQENEAREEVRTKIRGLRNGARREEGDYHKNRRLIKKLKDLAEKKDYEAAEALSQQQLERIHARLTNDAGYREEYFRLMRKQNPRRYLDAADDADAPGQGMNISMADLKADPASMEAARVKA
eukprot:CAMPEP_0118942838 /NCGR_PEP_ID=MMETSP1169-20130426/36959_1 /TAXON_ID=36882 /ORGANISM="Pyramimonas obovata, Strain CCMP722" /LENGTH=489 /DNA_ID=CAMNT_0006887931 /DNA_START=82 /DNA_END=1547 /DNA_ORIENTATION=-